MGRSPQIEDLIICLLNKQKEFQDDKPGAYLKWLEKIKNIMQNLLNQQEKYEDIIDNIKSMPIFSPTRDVLVEKTKK